MNLPLAQHQQPQQPDEPPELLLPSMALSNDFELLGQGADGDPQVPGCFLTVRCDGEDGRPCGQKFLVDLLDTTGAKQCPRCGARLVHALLVARDDDPTILEEAFMGITRANGLGLREAQQLAQGAVNQGPGDDEDDGQADDDDGEGDDDEQQ